MTESFAPLVHDVAGPVKQKIVADCTVQSQASAIGSWRGFAANPAAKAGVPQFVGGKMRTYT